MLTILEQAKKELEEEAFRDEVEAMKVKLKQKKSLFPWRIIFKVININKEQ